jgi:DNA-binding XRE family transcriptional regulator
MNSNGVTIATDANAVQTLRLELSTGCPEFRALYPLFGFSSGRYPVYMEGRSHPQEERHSARPRSYARKRPLATIARMELQHTPRPSRHAPRFPNKIREYRLKAGLSQRKLAKFLGRGRNAVSSWERGLTLPNVPRLMRMAKILGTLAESLYMEFYATLSEEPEPTNVQA